MPRVDLPFQGRAPVATAFVCELRFRTQRFKRDHHEDITSIFVFLPADTRLDAAAAWLPT
jgi:hypothetical protein